MPVPLLDPDTESHVNDLIDAMAAAVTVFLTGLPEDDPTATVDPSPNAPAGLPPVTLAYWTGKLAADVGAGKAATTSPEEFEHWLKTVAADLDETDIKALEGANAETAKWVKGRAEAMKQRLRTLMDQAEKDFQEKVEGAVNSGAIDEDALRDESLSELADDVDDSSLTFTHDLHRLTQTSFLTILQRAYAFAQKGDPWCFKVPRASACEYCLDLHLDADGSPKKYRLSEVRGNSNVGAKPDEWTFVIGATHPHCYCQFYTEDDPTAPDPDEPNKTLAQAKARSLEKNLLGGPLPKLDPLIPHEKVLLTELRKIFGPLEVY